MAGVGRHQLELIFIWDTRKTRRLGGGVEALEARRRTELIEQGQIRRTIEPSQVRRDSSIGVESLRIDTFTDVRRAIIHVVLAVDAR